MVVLLLLHCVVPIFPYFWHASCLFVYLSVAHCLIPKKNCITCDVYIRIALLSLFTNYRNAGICKCQHFCFAHSCDHGYVLCILMVFCISGNSVCIDHAMIIRTLFSVFIVVIVGVQQVNCKPYARCKSRIDFSFFF